MVMTGREADAAFEAFEAFMQKKALNIQEPRPSELLNYVKEIWWILDVLVLFFSFDAVFQTFFLWDTFIYNSPNVLLWTMKETFKASLFENMS